MKLTKAIELLNLYEHAADSIPRDDFLDALKLGIKALKAIDSSRRSGLGGIIVDLPGETPEGESP